MITLSWETIFLTILVITLGAIVLYLWLRERTPRKASQLARATAELINNLSCEVEALKERIRDLEAGALMAKNQITMLQSELALANSEVQALEQLVKEQSERIADLKAENEQLRREMARLEGK